MAEEAKEENQEKEESKSEKSGGSNIVLILIVVLLVLVLAIGGVVAYLMLSGDEADDGTVVKQEKVEKKHKRKSEDLAVGPMYPLDKFTVNLMSDNGTRYLVVKMNLEEDGEELTPELDKKTPMIRDIIISILSSKTVEEITTAKGKEKLKEEIINQINKHLDDGEIRHVYFTEFVIQ
ncbi:flagellar basal body-associated protein FliL [Hydrogenimonas sp. SS33]|uniref:flagellar basal body-associated protein FliL n=1 Tax=Hydrogenimonas leucolamina TaxID=2954236 RepID=UPI00336C19BF